jgi:hypothetical protein
VDAGPDIDVCQGGSVGLNGNIGGNSARGFWQGGKGQFDPNRKSLQVEYTPDSSEYGKEVVLSLVADNPNYPECPKKSDDVILRVNKEVKADAGANQKICPGEKVHVHGKMLKGAAQRTEWVTTGTGTFDDVTKLDAVYTPSKQDASKQGCSIRLVAYPFGVCLPDSDAFALTIIEAPAVEIATSGDATNGKAYELKADITGSASSILWSSNGTGTFSKQSKAETTYTPSAEDAVKNSVLITIQVKGRESDCVVSEKVNLKVTE